MMRTKGYWQFKKWGKTHDEWVATMEYWNQRVNSYVRMVLTQGNENLQDEAEDIVQLAWMKLMSGWQTCRYSNRKPWIKAVATNAAMDYVRKFNNRSVPYTSYDDPGFSDPLRDERAEPELRRREISADLDRLPHRQREALLLTAEGRKAPEIAKMIGGTPESVRQDICRGRKAMRGLSGPTRPGRRMPAHRRNESLADLGSESAIDHRSNSRSGAEFTDVGSDGSRLLNGLDY